MGATRFILALHNHQPVGNFENVFREAFEKCYDPFLKFLEEHPFLTVSLHYSGCLLDWLEAREKQFLRRLKRLIHKNQVEILSGGYYEPILPLIPERDAAGQIRYMNRYLARHFGRDPQGFWLTERVWEPKLPRIAAQAGLKFTAVDDSHFSLAGLAESEIKDFFITEEEGFPLFLFPIPKSLRYAIPFNDPGETIEYLRKRASESDPSSVVTYADDGEKFGLWPGTYQWLYREGWLERFARALEENGSWLKLKTFSQVLEEEKGRPVKKVYLPTASYEEMGEWALSNEKALEFSKLKKELISERVWEEARFFFQGGIFKNFLTRYSEADWMRSKMKWVSAQVAKVRNPKKKKKAERELWQAQCNCPYWHGVFGGLYLHHLRRSTYEHLIRAESLSNSAKPGSFPRLIEEDLNEDSVKEVVIESRPFAFYFLPHRGGVLTELDFRPQLMNVLDTLTRREEAYHREILGKKGGGQSKGKSIHDLAKKVAPEILERAAFDPWERFSLLDYFLPPATTFEDYWKARFQSLVKDPTQIFYSKNWKKNKKGGELILRAEIPLQDGEVEMEKRVQINADKNQFEIFWSLTNRSPKKLDCLWGAEWGFNFFDREKQYQDTRQIKIQDGWSPVNIQITGEEAFDYWQFPIETLSQTEVDFRLIHQGISVFPHWRMNLQPQETFHRHLSFRFSNKP